MLPRLGFFDMAFSDVPDNIGRAYNEYDDNLPVEKYLEFLDGVIRRLLLCSKIVWVSFNARWTIQMGEITAAIVRESGIEVKPCTQVFTFGTQMQHDLKNCHRPLWRFMRPGTPLYPDQAREPSWRLLNGDKRADPRGAVPGDVFDFPRITGNSKQKRKWHNNQLHEGVIERCVKLCTPEGGSVVDSFGGTGTTLRVCQRLSRSCTLIEYDAMYCSEIAKEHDLEISKIA
ncbi:site-specific DNA-methyltransferase [Planctomicrobium sp. SH661]|uniref:site-specific DNA-methyltransferase n=1 Tax=Planctomicrobium sp. SH661 TaxID=3448124 RepID=UPI003F5C9279